MQPFHNNIKTQDYFINREHCILLRHWINLKLILSHWELDLISKQYNHDGLYRRSVSQENSIFA